MTTLKEFQRIGVDKISLFGGRALLADEMGLGKTIQALSWMVQHQTYPAVVICQAGLKYHWANEAARHFNIHAEILKGTKPPQYGIISKKRLIIVNYEILKSWHEHITQLQPQLLIIDECHCIKSRSAIRTRHTQHIARRVRHVIALSGTPMLNRPEELWTTLNIIRPDRYPSFFPFAHRYCGARRTPWGWEFKGATRIDELNHRLKSELMIRRLKKNVLKELPPKQRSVIPIDIERPEEYAEAENEFILWLRKHHSNARVNSALRAEWLTRGGYLKRLAAQLKMKAVMNWHDSFLQECHNKIIIFAVHKNIIRELYSRYQHIAVFIDGDVTEKNRQKAIAQFTNNSHTRMMIASIQAAGTGWNGSAASAVSFVELDWVPALHSQAEDRPHRIGQTKSVNIYYLIAHRTIEERLCDVLQSKQKTINVIMNSNNDGDPLNVMDLLTDSYLRNNR